MTLLVTGGTGFLGSYLTRHALEEGSEEHVDVLDSYAADAARSAGLALSADRLCHNLYNVRAERQPFGEFIQTLRELPPSAEVAVSPNQQAGNPHFAMDATRLRTDLGFSRSYTLRSGLEDYIRRIRLFDSNQREGPGHAPLVGC